jgi:hypothetical protein
MYHLIKKIISFYFIFILLIVLIFSIWVLISYPEVDIPAPNLSNSYSFNEKMLFMNGQNKAMNLDVLAIGSSLTLNNLQSISVTEILNTENFVNASSWGLGMKDNFHLLKVLNEIYNPKELIMVINLIDFQNKNKHVNIKFNYLKDFLSTNFSFIYHLKTFNLEYYFDNIRYSQKVRNCINDYEYLGFDKYGGVNFCAEDFKIDITSWNGDSEFSDLDVDQYQYMDSIASFCNNKAIKLYVFQSPFRQGYYLNIDETEKKMVHSHSEMIQKIINKYNISFANSLDRTWSDSLFVDVKHLNDTGAKLFTEYCFEKIEKQ